MSLDNLFLDGADSSFFWTRPVIYAHEQKVPRVNVPVWRLVNSVIIIYTVYIGIDFIGGLCTYATEVACSVTLFVCSVYWSWATWWDERYAVPATWSFIKAQRFHPIWIIVWLIFYAILVSLVIFLIIGAFILTYADYQKAFEWQCWENDWA